jgi:8-oxo-dGTP pyrophosphatase MutT (NUDIX family)
MVSPANSDNSATALTGASVIVLRPDAVLMVLRRRAPLEGLWSFPGGRSERGETPEATARRELLEETGLAVEQLVPIGAFQPAPERSLLRLTVFAARAPAASPRAGDDALQAEFVPLSHVLGRPITPGAIGWLTRAILALSNPPVL